MVTRSRAEVNRSIELEELQKMKSEFEGAARDVEQSVNREMSATTSELENSWKEAAPAGSSSSMLASAYTPPPPEYKHPKKHWRLKRGAMPAWYKQRQGIRTQALSGAARVARFRPKPLAK